MNIKNLRVVWLLVFFIILIGSAGLNSATAQTACTATGVLGTAPSGGTTGTLATRLSRTGGASSCTSAVFPGTSSDTGPFIYNTHRVNNTTANPICVTVILTVNVGGTAVSNVQVAAFLAPFTAADISNASRYLGDPGSSSGNPPNVTTFAFTIPANTAVDLVVFNTITSPAGQGTQYTLSYSSAPSLCATTAAGAMVRGKVLSNIGKRGLIGATVIMTDTLGNERSARTLRAGNFHFEDVPVGETYIFSVKSKRYNFAPQVINLFENLEELNFVALP